MRLLRKLMIMLMMLIVVFGVMPVTDSQAKDVVIVLDPGHGGGDPGAFRTVKKNGKTYMERELNPKIAKYCKAELESYQGVKVYIGPITMNGVVTDRETRVNYAKKVGADALVSIHLNSTGDTGFQNRLTGAFCCVPSASGFPGSESAKAARNLADSILKELHMQVGLKNNGYWIDDELGIIVFGQKADYKLADAQKWGITKAKLNTKIPSLIVEHCFINNENDCLRYLNSNTKLKALGIADATGIAKYFGLVRKSSSPSGTPDPNVTSGWITKDENKYYYDTDGKMCTGWKQINSSYYYFNESGVLQTGVFTIESDKYLADDKGVRQSGFVKYNGKYYYPSPSGKLQYGWQQIGTRTCYFDLESGAAFTGLQTIDGKKYYFSSMGGIKKKWITIAGKKFYFSVMDGHLLTKYWLKYGGNWYYLNSSGSPFTSCTKKIDGVKYIFDENGICTNKE